MLCNCIYLLYKIITYVNERNPTGIVEYQRRDGQEFHKKKQYVNETIMKSVVSPNVHIIKLGTLELSYGIQTSKHFVTFYKA